MTRNPHAPLLHLARRLHLVLLALGLNLPLAAQVLESTLPPPGINAPFVNPDVTQWIEAFEHEGREIWD